MSCAHLIYGFIGAGKSTFSRELEAKINAVRFSQDEWMTAAVGINPSPGEFQAKWDAINALMTGVWKRVLSVGVDIIIDEGMWHRARRDSIRELVTETGNTFKLYHVTCSEDVMKARVGKRNQNLTDSFYIDEAAFKSLKQQLEPLGSDEVHEVICTG